MSPGLLRVDLPQRKYQIPRETFGPAPSRAAFRFAFELGTGVRTYITASAPYALAATLVLCSPRDLRTALGVTAAAAVGYGIGRSVIVASQCLRRSVAVDHPRGWLRSADLIAVAAAATIAVRTLAAAT